MTDKTSDNSDWPAPGTIEDLETFGKAIFSAEFLANHFVRLRYGRQASKLIHKTVFDGIAIAHRGALVKPSGKDSIDSFLSDPQNASFFCKTHLQSYVCPLLVRLGYAVFEGNQLRFKPAGA
jgi:hypothetical protein